MCFHYSRLDCYRWPPCVTAYYWSSPNPTRDVITPFAASLVHAGVKSQINRRLLTGLCSRVTPAICLTRLSNWGTRLNDSPAWIRPVTEDKTRSAVVEINSLKTKWTAELGVGRAPSAPGAGHATDCNCCLFATCQVAVCFSISLVVPQLGK